METDQVPLGDALPKSNKTKHTKSRRNKEKDKRQKQGATWLAFLIGKNPIFKHPMCMTTRKKKANISMGTRLVLLPIPAILKGLINEQESKKKRA